MRRRRVVIPKQSPRCSRCLEMTHGCVGTPPKPWGRSGDPQAVPALLQAVLGDDHETVRRAAVKALTRLRLRPTRRDSVAGGLRGYWVW
jgi:hypothetical protein